MGFPARRRDRPSESQVSPKAAWYDRNAVVVRKVYEGESIAPPLDLIRWQYTVPTGKKAYLELGYMRVRRRTAATTVGDALAEIYYQPSGQSYERLVTATHRDNTAGSVKDLTVPQSVMMLEGDVLYGYTGDDSIGGTMDYRVIGKLTQFDG